jgi:hypothetical protein
VIRITTAGKWRSILELRPPSTLALKARSIPGRIWDAERRCWLLPPSCVPAAIEDFNLAGLRVVVDGETAAVNPFVPLRASMPKATWLKVAKVLCETLDPAAGEADERLLNLLRRTMRADDQRERRADQERQRRTA